MQLSFKLYNYFYDIINFVFIFSLFNDNYFAQAFGSNSLRAIFALFILFNLKRLYKNFTNPVLLKELIPFFIFLSLNFFILIINPGSDDKIHLLNNFLLLIAMFVITVVYINCDFNKVIYFIWIAILLSVIILVFNKSISQWTFRKTGGTNDPNEFATQLLSFIALSIFLFRKNKNYFFLIISVIAFVYAILQAASLSSFLAFGVISVFVLLRYMRLAFAKSLVTAVIALVLFGFIFLTFQDNILKMKSVNNVMGRTEKTQTAQSRFKSWNAGLNMFVDKPFLGVGMNNYGDNSPKYSKVYLAKDAVAPHNVYLKALAETGILVFFSFIIFLLDLFTKHFKRIISTDFFWIYLASISYMLMGFTLGLNYNKYLWLTLALLMNVHIQIYLQRKAQLIVSNNIKEVE
ncbi:MAG: O-antigen ligase family protein [Ignavibacteriales bacterium]|nr:O-antigen ligase family protein [Ignavibacteriales bacterium]